MKYVARNGYIYGMQKTMRNDVSHIKLEQPAQKLYKQKVCGGHLGFSLFVHFLQNIDKVAVGICRDDFHWPTFTARHAPQILLAPWVYLCHFLRFWQPSWIFPYSYGYTLIMLFSDNPFRKNSVRNYCNLCRVYHSLRTWSRLPVPFKFNLTLTFTPTTQICPQSVK